MTQSQPLGYELENSDPCTHCGGETFRPATSTAVLAVRRAPNVMHQLHVAPRHRISEKPATTRRAALTVPAYGQMWRVYYYAGGQAIAMRTQEIDPIFFDHYTVLYYLHTDHLGSTSVTTCGHANCGTVGQVLSRQSYYPYGGVRQQSGVQVTKRGYTAQYDDGLGGLLFFNARYYLSGLARFISADTLVPGMFNPQTLNRLMFVLGNPLKYTDPSGHMVLCDENCENNGGSLRKLGKLVPPRPRTNAAQSSPIDPIPLQIYDYSGEQMYELYLAYQRTPGWWNDNSQTLLWLEEFLGYIILRETWNALGAEALMIEVVARHLWADASGDAKGHKPFCVLGTLCINGVFNFLAQYSQTAHELFDEYRVNGRKISSDDSINGLRPNPNRPAFRSSAFDVGYQVLHPKAEWTIYNNNLPYHWGNFFNLAPAQYEAWGYVYRYDNFFILTANQRNRYPRRKRSCLEKQKRSNKRKRIILRWGVVLAYLLVGCVNSSPLTPTIKPATTKTEKVSTTQPTTQELLTPIGTFSVTPIVTLTPNALHVSTVTPTPNIPPSAKLSIQCLDMLSELPSSASARGLVVMAKRDFSGAYLLDVGTGLTHTLPGGQFGIYELGSVSPDRTKLAYLRESIENNGSMIKVSLVITNINNHLEVIWPWPYTEQFRGFWLNNQDLLIGLAQPPSDTERQRPREYIVFDTITGAVKKLSSDYPDIMSIPPLPNWETNMGQTAYAPNLNYVIYASSHDYVLWNLTTEQVVAKLPSQNVSEYAPEWTSDSSQVVIAADVNNDRDRAYELFRIMPDGSIEQLTDLASYYLKSRPNAMAIRRYRWSPDNHLVAFWLTTWPGTGRRSYDELHILDATTLQVTNYCVKGNEAPGDIGYSIFGGTTGVAPPIWSTDGTQVVVENRYEDNRSRAILVDLVRGFAAVIADNAMPVGWMISP